VTMPGIPYSASVSFNGSAIGNVVGIQVETPTAEIVDMTGMFDPVNKVVAVPTGAYTGGSITIDYLADAVPNAELGTVGEIVFASTAITVSRRGILESATVEASAGELVRGTMKFRLTDYVP